MRKEEGTQYPLRGYDPYTGRIVPFEVDTPEGKGIRTQRDVDIQIEYDLVIKQGRENLQRNIRKLTASSSQPK